MNSQPLVPFRFLCSSQRWLLSILALSGGLLGLGIGVDSQRLAILCGAAVWCALAGYMWLALLQVLFQRGQFLVACPICERPMRSAAWTVSFQCHCPRCRQVYAAGWLRLRYFSPRAVDIEPACKDHGAGAAR